MIRRFVLFSKENPFKSAWYEKKAGQDLDIIFRILSNTKHQPKDSFILFH